MESAKQLARIEVNARKVRIDSARMNPRERRIFEIYLGMGEDRSLEKLFGYCRDEGIIASIATLKQWSIKYAWQALLEQIEADIADELGKALLPDHVERTKNDLAHIQRMKLKFYRKVESDEIDITVEEYIKLLKIEETLIGRPTERSSDGELTGKYKVEIQLNEEQLAVALALSASSRHNLPPPRNVTPVIEQHGESSNGEATVDQ